MKSLRRKFAEWVVAPLLDDASKLLDRIDEIKATIDARADISAQNWKEAVECLQRHSAEIDAAFTELNRINEKISAKALEPKPPQVRRAGTFREFRTAAEHPIYQGKDSHALNNR